MNRESLRQAALQEQHGNHRFRRNIPSAIAKIARKERDSDAAAKNRWMGEDISLFLLSFLAFFTAFYTFIF